MRLLFVIDSLGSGGAQRQLTNLAVALAGRGHAIDVFVYHDIDHFKDRLRAAGVRVLLHRKPSRYSFAPVRALRSLYRDGDYDLVLSFQTVPNTYALLAAVAIRRRPRIVVSERFLPRPGLAGRRNRLCEFLYPRADRVTTNSHHMREYYRRRYGWTDALVTTIWNGLDLADFPSTPLVRHADEPLRLLCIGRMDPAKNWHKVAEAASRLASKGIRATVTHVGRLHRLIAIEQDYYASLILMLDRLGPQANWTFLGEQDDIARLLAEHHVLVHPSSAEGLSNAVCESLACGRPVLASDAFDHRRLIQDGRTGWLFDQNDVESVAAAIRRAADLPGEQLAAMGANARRFAEEHLSVARLADEYEALFERLTAKSSRGRALDSAAGPNVAQAPNRR